jgi:two-component system chemotaxis sensor kinase CheA
VTELLDVRAAILAADPAFYSTHPTALTPVPTVPESTPTSLLEV